MLRLATEGNPPFEVSDIEYKRGGISYTVETIEEMKKANPSFEPLLILGVDAFLDIPNWHRSGLLMEMSDFVIVNRPPFDLKDILSSPYIKEGVEGEGVNGQVIELISGRLAIPLACTPVGISASGIRDRLKRGMSIKYLLPESVESYIISNGLYQNARS